MASHYGIRDAKGYVLRMDIGPGVQSIPNNNTPVAWALYLECTSSYFQDYTANFSAILDGTTVANITSQYVSLPGTNSSVLLCSGTQTIPHTADGSKTLTFSGSFRTNVQSSYTPVGTIVMSGSEVLPTIPRAALANSFNDFAIEVTAGLINGNLTVYSTAFSHYVQLFKNGVERANWTIAAGPVGSYNYSLALSTAQRDAIFADMPSSVSDVFTLVVTTWNGATQIGSGQSRTATGTIPAGYKPSITTANSNFSWVNKNGALPAHLIQNVSTLTLLLSGGSVSTGTSLTEYRVRFGTITRQAAYSGAAISENVGLITTYGNLLAYYAIKDSRGRWSDEISETMSVQAYNPPITNGFTIRRNVATPTSADYILKFSNSLYALGNTWAYIPYYWNGTTWVACNVSAAIAAASVDAVYTHGLPYSESLVYNVKVALTDLFNTAEYTDVLATSAFPFVFGKRGIGIGKDTADVYDLEVGLGGIDSDGVVGGTQLKSDVPIGTPPLTVVSSTIVPILNVEKVGGSTLAQILLAIYPVGSIFTSVNSVNPATLFGGTWVSFSNGRALVGVFASDTDFNASEKFGGEKAHLLSLAEIPSHNHLQANVDYFVAISGSNLVAGHVLSGYPQNGTGTSYSGGGLAHNTMMPYMVVYFWKRTA